MGSIVLEWEFNENNGSATVADSSGYSHTGSVAATGVTLGDSSATFDGQGFDYITSETAPEFGYGSFSYGFWIKMARQATWSNPFQKGGTNSSTPGFCCLVQGTAQTHPGSPGCIIEDANNVELSPITTTIQVDDDRWHRLAITVDRTGALMSAYVDGASVGSIAIPSNFMSVTNTGQALIAGRLMSGSMDDVTLWDYALTPAQALADFEAGRSPLPVATQSKMTIQDYLWQEISGGASTKPLPNQWVRFTENTTATQFFSNATTDIVGRFEMDNITPGIYTVEYGPSQTGNQWTTTSEAYPVYSIIDPASLVQLSQDGSLTVPVMTAPTIIVKGKPWYDITGWGAEPGVDIASIIQGRLDQANADGNGRVLIPPGPWLSSRIVIPSGVTVDAEGAVLTHAGAAEVFLDWTSATYSRWWGGKIVAGASTTDITLLSGTNHVRFEPLEIMGNSTGQNGVHVLGRKGFGVYYNRIAPLSIHGCTGPGIWVDGWDPTNSPVQGNFANGNRFLDTALQSNGVGLQIDGGEGNFFSLEDAESNTGFGIVMGPHPIANQINHIWLESNNGSTGNEQIYVDTTTDPAAQQSNIFIGIVGTTSTQDYWALFVNQRQSVFGRSPQIPSGPTASRPSSPTVGQVYFDTTLGKLITYSGTAWVDGSGASV